MSRGAVCGGRVGGGLPGGGRADGVAGCGSGGSAAVASGPGELLTCDLVCYGVASPAVFAEYLAMLERKRGRRLTDYAHRGRGLRTRADEAAFYDDGSCEQGSVRTRAWVRLWYRYLVRESCFACGYHSLERPGSLTIGDFWGIERALSGMDDGWGVSCVLANDARGLELLRAVSGRFELVQVAPSDVANSEQPMLLHPPERGDRDAFWELRCERGFEGACRALGVLGAHQTLRDAVGNVRARLGMLRGTEGGAAPAGGGVAPDGGEPACAASPKAPDFDALAACGAYPLAFAARNRSGRVRRASSSGGVFHALAAHVIEELHGVVYGCAFDESLRAVHVRCETLPEAEHCMGSKYAQSDLGDTLRSVRDDLAAGKTVLFTGTPCQVAAVRAFCGAPVPPRRTPSVAAGSLPELYRSRARCCGCTACAAACPCDAIAMEPDEEGFCYPHIDPARCVGCGACADACTFKARCLGE